MQGLKLRRKLGRISNENINFSLNGSMCNNYECTYISWLPASVARMRRPTGDKEVAGSTQPRSATYFRRDRSLNIFYGHSLPSADSRRAVFSFWRKNVHNTD